MPMPRSPRNNCLNCSKECSRPEKIYCNNTCQHAHKRKEVLNLWVSGESCDISDRLAKNLLIDLRGYKCEVCGISDWRGKELGLEIDHIDGDWSNHWPENVRLICPNCHSQTDTYKNKGGRPSTRTLDRSQYPSRYLREQ